MPVGFVHSFVLEDPIHSWVFFIILLFNLSHRWLVHHHIPFVAHTAHKQI